MSQNPRLAYSINRNSFRCSIDASVFHFGEDLASRDAAFAKLQEHGTRLIDALDKRAGRTLTARELILGTEHPETRSKEELITKRQLERAAEQSRAEQVVNPYTELAKLHQKKESPRQRLERLSKEWEEKQAADADRKAFESDPQRLKAVAHAEAELRRLRHDPSVTVAEIEAAEGRVELARTGDLKQYAAEDREWRKVLADKLSDRTVPIDVQIAALRQQKQDILAGAFDDPPSPVVVEAPSQFSDVPVAQMTREEIDAAFAADRELVARQKAARNST